MLVPKLVSTLRTYDRALREVKDELKAHLATCEECLRELPQLDEKLYLEVFAPPRPAAPGPKRTPRAATPAGEFALPPVWSNRLPTPITPHPLRSRYR